MEVHVTLDPDLTPPQRKAIFEAMGPGWVHGEQASAADPLTVGALIISVGFVAKSLLDGFLKEAGKDAYQWLKARRAVQAAESAGPLQTRYTAQVGEVTVQDRLSGGCIARHDHFLEAVQEALEAMPGAEAVHIRSVDLEYDEALHRYTTASFYELDIYRRPAVSEPVAKVDLPATGTGA